MKLIVVKDYEALSQLTAHIVIGEMIQNRRVNLSLTTGNTPKRFYEILIDHTRGADYLENVHFYNFDEISIKGERYGLTMQASFDAYFTPAKIKSQQIHEMNETNYEQFDEKIVADGGLDLVLMGIGSDGHFCANMPGSTNFDSYIYPLPIPEGSEVYEGLKKMMGKEPGELGATFGPMTIMHARKLVLFANGKAKAAIIKQALEGPVTEAIPSSVLKLHPNLIVILDEEAASELTR